MSKYGFGDEPETTAETIATPAIALPTPKKGAARPPKEAVQAAAREGERIGFVSRDPGPPPEPEPAPARSAGRRRRSAEPYGQILISGPQHVCRRFQEFCDSQGFPSYWSALSDLMDQAESEQGRGSPLPYRRR